MERVRVSVCNVSLPTPSDQAVPLGTEELADSPEAAPMETPEADRAQGSTSPATCVPQRCWRPLRAADSRIGTCFIESLIEGFVNGPIEGLAKGPSSRPRVPRAPPHRLLPVQLTDSSGVFRSTIGAPVALGQGADVSHRSGGQIWL